MVTPVGTFFIVLFVLIVVGLISWVVFTQLRARRLGLPAPSFSSYNPFAHSDHRASTYSLPTPAPGTVRDWFSDKWRALRSLVGGSNSRSATGAYEGQPSRQGFGPLDPDSAWDTRVNDEADHYGPGGYYEEQELGLRSGGGDTSYAGATRYDEQHHAPQGLGLHQPATPPSTNPFGDEAEPANMHVHHGLYGGSGGSPTHSERRSIFRENV